MFGSKRMDGLEDWLGRMKVEIAGLRRVPEGVEFPAVNSKVAQQYVAWGLAPPRQCAGIDDVAKVRDELRTLATALGYRWVPEGKTAAKWEKAPEPYENQRIGSPFHGSCPIIGPTTLAAFERMERSFSQTRRKGDRPQAGRKKGVRRGR